MLSRDKGTSRQQHCAGWQNAQLVKQCGGRTSAGTLCYSAGARNSSFLHWQGAFGPSAPRFQAGIGKGRTMPGAVAVGGHSAFGWMFQELEISPLSRLRARWYNKSFVLWV